MDRRTLLKLLGGVAALPALGKAIKGTGIKSIKAAGKVLPKVQGILYTISYDFQQIKFYGRVSSFIRNF